MGIWFKVQGLGFRAGSSPVLTGSSTLQPHHHIIPKLERAAGAAISSGERYRVATGPRTSPSFEAKPGEGSGVARGERGPRLEGVNPCASVSLAPKRITLVVSDPALVHPPLRVPGGPDHF